MSNLSRKTCKDSPRYVCALNQKINDSGNFNTMFNCEEYDYCQRSCLSIKHLALDFFWFYLQSVLVFVLVFPEVFISMNKIELIGWVMAPLPLSLCLLKV